MFGVQQTVFGDRCLVIGDRCLVIGKTDSHGLPTTSEALGNIFEMYVKYLVTGEGGCGKYINFEMNSLL